MVELLEKSRRFPRTNEAEAEMDKLKVKFTSASVLQYDDFTKKIFLLCGASDFGIGSMLVQLSNERDRMHVKKIV